MSKKNIIFSIFFLGIIITTNHSFTMEIQMGGQVNMEKATFAAGCFWGVQSAFDKVDGVLKTTVGYSGGTVENPGYYAVCSGKTGHAEAIEIEYDSSKVSYEELVQGFFKIHDPTTLNRQGPDIGTQYRSAIFYHNPEQEKVAQSIKTQLTEAGDFTNPIVTEITQASEFYPAEDYHQKYFEKKGIDGGCHI